MKRWDYDENFGLQFLRRAKSDGVGSRRQIPKGALAKLRVENFSNQEGRPATTYSKDFTPGRTGMPIKR